VIEELTKIGAGDITSVLHVHLLPSVWGNCNYMYCPHKTLVYSGTGGVGDWWYMPTHSIQLLKLKDNYMTLFESILEVRLSEQAVRSVASQPSAQKCEAFNSLNNTETYQPLTELCSSAGFQNT
jgi:hypothetical protein